MHVKKTKHVRDRKGTRDYSLGEQSPYWAWIHATGAFKYKDGNSRDWEPTEANPDQLSEEQSLYFQREPNNEQMKKLAAIERSLENFTENERKVVLLLYGGMSLGDAAKKMRTTKSNVQGILNRAREKVLATLAKEEEEF